MCTLAVFCDFGAQHCLDSRVSIGMGATLPMLRVRRVRGAQVSMSVSFAAITFLAAWIRMDLVEDIVEEIREEIRGKAQGG